jgi:NDP-sugar pyrophosphorylase family protein
MKGIVLAGGTGSRLYPLAVIDVIAFLGTGQFRRTPRAATE